MNKSFYSGFGNPEGRFTQKGTAITETRERQKERPLDFHDSFLSEANDARYYSFKPQQPTEDEI